MKPQFILFKLDALSPILLGLKDAIRASDERPTGSARGTNRLNVPEHNQHHAIAVGVAVLVVFVIRGLRQCVKNVW